MDIEQLEKLNELKKKGVLTEEEFDKQLAIYLNSDDKKKIAKSTEEEKTQKESIGSSIIVWIILGIAAYIYVDKMFVESITCTEKATAEQCECVKRAIANDVGFLDKVRILFTGASAEELSTYAPGSQLLCAFR